MAIRLNVILGAWRVTPALSDGACRVNLRLGEVGRNGRVIEFDEPAFRLVAALLCRPGGLFGQDESAEIIWHDDLDGGPDDAFDEVDGLACALRVALAPLGLVVDRHWRQFSIHDAADPFLAVVPRSGPPRRGTEGAKLELAMAA